VNAGIRRLLLLIGTTVIALGAAEVVVRVAGLAPSLVVVPIGDILAVPDPELMWVLNPAAEGMSQPGLRGPAPENPKRRRRVLVIGDSVAHGTGLPESDSIPRQLERELRAAGKDIEVLNGGVPGYDSRQQARALEVFLPQLEPDLVLVVYCLNDAFTTPGFPESLKRNAKRDGKQDEVRELLAHARDPSAVRILTRSSHLARLLMAAWRSRTQDPMESAELNRTLGFDAAVRSLGGVKQAFRRMRQAAGALPVVVAIAPLFRFKDHYSEPDVHASVAALATDAGLLAFDLLPPVEAHFRKTRQNLAQDDDRVHPNAEGVRVIAEALTPRIEEWLGAK
jgi:lysophospholipase L1-like esterase